METKTVDVYGKDYKIKELTYGEALSLKKIENSEEADRKMLEISLVEPKIDPNETSLKTVLKLMKFIKEINGLSEDFTSPQNTKPDTQKS